MCDESMKGTMSKKYNANKKSEHAKKISRIGQLIKVRKKSICYNFNNSQSHYRVIHKFLKLNMDYIYSFFWTVPPEAPSINKNFNQVAMRPMNVKPITREFLLETIKNLKPTPNESIKLEIQMYKTYQLLQDTFKDIVQDTVPDAPPLTRDNYFYIHIKDNVVPRFNYAFIS